MPLKSRFSPFSAHYVVTLASVAHTTTCFWPRFRTAHARQAIARLPVRPFCAPGKCKVTEFWPHRAIHARARGANLFVIPACAATATGEIPNSLAQFLLLCVCASQPASQPSQHAATRRYNDGGTQFVAFLCVYVFMLHTRRAVLLSTAVLVIACAALACCSHCTTRLCCRAHNGNVHNITSTICTHESGTQ